MRVPFVCLSLALAGCTPTATQTPPPNDVRASPVCASPHAFLRSQNTELIDELCRAEAAESPRVNLHGDLHLEQYVVSDTASGLADFDDATVGPVVIDFAHIALSIRLVSIARRWDGDALFTRFLDGYRYGLGEPHERTEASSFDARIRANFRGGRTRLLAYCDRLATWDEETVQSEYTHAFGELAELLVRLHREPSIEQLAVVRVGHHDLGIGSHGSQKVLLRLRGASDDPDDDRIFELKEIPPLAPSCIDPDQEVPERVLRAEERLEAGLLGSVGFVTIGTRSFWVNEWAVHYQELRVDDPELSSDEVSEVLYAIGAQLGQGHPRGLETPGLTEQLRAYVEQEGERLWRESESRAERMESRWRAHRAQNHCE